jgi:hypothetical protein
LTNGVNDMPSEKSRYLNRNRGPTQPFEFLELRERIAFLGVSRLAELLWIRAQNDDVLTKALMVTLSLNAGGDSELAKRAIDYALHFPDYVRYTERGHGQILDEIKISLQDWAEDGHREFALQLARYAIERAQSVSENFEDDWAWTCSLENLRKWADELDKS